MKFFTVFSEEDSLISGVGNPLCVVFLHKSCQLSVEQQLIIMHPD